MEYIELSALDLSLPLALDDLDAAMDSALELAVLDGAIIRVVPEPPAILSRDVPAPADEAAPVAVRRSIAPAAAGGRVVRVLRAA